MWTLPILFLLTTIALSIPVGFFTARMLDGRVRLPGFLNWIEKRIDSGPQDWKQYALAMLLWNALTFVVGFLILQFQNFLPLNPDNKGILSPTTVFNTACSFLSNTNLQHYSGEVHLTYFSQLFFICWKQFHTPAIGLACLAALVRGLRGDAHMGNFYVDLWRSIMYVLLPMATIVALLLMVGGMPMTLDGNVTAKGLEGGEQVIARGPVAAIVAIKQLGTNGGGFFGPNSSHPYENPNDWTNWLECLCIMLLPMAAVVMFGKMLNNMRHAAVVFGVMLVLFASFIGWAVYWDSMFPNPALTAHAEQSFEIPDAAAEGGVRKVTLPAVDGLPVAQELGNLEGKELRFWHFRRSNLGRLHNLYVERFGELHA